MNPFRIAGAVAVLLAAACIGARARQSVMLPSLQTAWASIRVEVEREVASQQSPQGETQLATADEAVEAGDAVKMLAVDWLLLNQLAENDATRRAATGEIGPGVVVSLAERRRAFAESVASYTRAPK